MTFCEVMLSVLRKTTVNFGGSVCAVSNLASVLSICIFSYLILSFFLRRISFHSVLLYLLMYRFVYFTYLFISLMFCFRFSLVYFLIFQEVLLLTFILYFLSFSFVFPIIFLFYLYSFFTSIHLSIDEIFQNLTIHIDC